MNKEEYKYIAKALEDKISSIEHEINYNQKSLNMWIRDYDDSGYTDIERLNEVIKEHKEELEKLNKELEFAKSVFNKFKESKDNE